MNIFVTGTGTGVGKTIVSAILAQALRADYWKPIQAGYAEGTDSGQVGALLSNGRSAIHPEVYKLKLPASPHLAAREEKITIDLQKIKNAVPMADNLIIEGAGGLMVPLNETAFVADLIRELDARVVIVSRNMLGSINHSLLTAMACRQYRLRVLGWIFTGEFMHYEQDVAAWSGYHHLGSIPWVTLPEKNFIADEANKMEQRFYNWPW